MNIQEDFMKKHQLTRNAFTFNYISTFIKLIHTYQNFER